MFINSVAVCRRASKKSRDRAFGVFTWKGYTPYKTAREAIDTHLIPAHHLKRIADTVEAAPVVAEFQHREVAIDGYTYDLSINKAVK